jgi:hypothetical protein
MRFVAKAKHGGACVYKKCLNRADKIYEDDDWRVLACSEAHARLVLELVEKYKCQGAKALILKEKNLLS